MRLFVCYQEVQMIKVRHLVRIFVLPQHIDSQVYDYSGTCARQAWAAGLD